ncbi:hypothetical protein L5515_009598 [Caenorhabditis briggsae]|uniref:Uncharacterized protein n=1 Tax=Caenorhabditis briggsae TaxID=6238 RepID=A0AAE9F4K1_CAEBR|nr:hypothetical protein L5515_009598 [Caenorhabditis briggsae]
MHPIGILLCVLVSIGYCTDTVVNVAFYCPKNKTWGYDIEAYGRGHGGTDSQKFSLGCDHKSNSLNTTFTFKCEFADLHFLTVVLIFIEHSCTSNGDVQKVEVMSEVPRKSETPAFVAWNLGTNDHAAAYEKLFVPYMKEECGKDGHTICTEYVTKTTSTSTTESFNLVPIIIGASVATIVLIGGLICFLKCRQGKKNQVLDPYGKTTGSKTKGSTTRRGTTTGESRRSTTEKKKATTGTTTGAPTKSTTEKKKKEKKRNKGTKNKKTETGETTGKKTGTEYI